MSTRFKIIIAIVALLTAYAFGRFSAPEKIKTVVQTVAVEKQVDKTQTEKQDHKKVTIVQKPDGTKTTTITDDSDTTRKSTDTTATTVDTKKEQEITYSSSKVTLSVLGGVQPSLSSPLLYGISATKPILGPITVGVWGLSNVTFGASLGLTF